MIAELKDALHLDYETRSTVNLPRTGPWVYAQHWSTQVWCACFARGDEEPEAWHPGDPVPETVARAARDGVPFIAHNVGFERAITAGIMAPVHGWPIIPLDRWYCTASMAAAMCLPRKLEDVARILGCLHQKDMEGHRLMLKMMRPSKRVKCVACRGKGVSPAGHDCPICETRGEFLYWHDDTPAIARGTAYCAQDVRTERSVCERLRALSPSERQVWLLDQTINERGVRVDIPTVNKALVIAKKATVELNQETQLLTGGVLTEEGEVVGGVVTSQVKKLRIWLATEGLNVKDLRKETVEGLLKSANLDDLVTQALELRQEAAKTSTAKLNAYLLRTCADGRMRDNLMYHGAGTGRWSGRGAQLQNLPSRYLLKKWQIEIALEMIAEGWSGEDLRRWIDTPLEVLSACLRGMIVASPGHIIYACDYNAIEARGTAWLADARALLGVFARGEDPYLFQAAGIYSHVDLSGVDWSDEKCVDEVKKCYARERQLGKIAVLGLGYQMGWEKFQATCAKDRILITDDEAKEVVFAYRKVSNPEVPQLWREMQDAAIEAVRNPHEPVEAAGGLIHFLKEGPWLYMRLPSGRLLSYAQPVVEKRELPWIDEETMRPAMGWGVSFMGVNSLTHKWSKQYAYGGKWVENAVQGLSRDLLASAMLRLEDAGYSMIVSVHDEAVSEVPEGFGSDREYEAIMCNSPAWAAGMPVKAEAWHGRRYRK